MPELAAHAEANCRVGLVGTFRASVREGFAQQVETALRQTLEELSGRWTVEVPPAQPPESRGGATVARDAHRPFLPLGELGRPSERWGEF